MRFALISILLFSSLFSSAQKINADSAAVPLVKQLNLSPAQKDTLAKYIKEFRQEEMKRKAVLRNKIFNLLSREQRLTWQKAKRKKAYRAPKQ